MSSRRSVTAVAAAVLLATGLYYAWIADDAQEGWRWCLQAPEARQGSELVFPLWTVTGVDDPHHYRISGFVKDLPVDGDSAGLAVGDTVSLVATFDWNGGKPIAHQTYFEFHRLRAWKERLGVIGFVLVAIFLPFCFVVRRDANGRWLAERRAWPEPGGRSG